MPENSLSKTENYSGMRGFAQVNLLYIRFNSTKKTWNGKMPVDVMDLAWVKRWNASYTASAI